MRPLKLTISAFGPYSGVEKIPMENLGDSGIYLITGPTGAGKTTIFDAIVFALYGEASGDVREPQMLRCKHADPSAATYVELEFALSDTVYIVRRNPQYERQAKRGGGFTTEKPGAELFLPSGKSVVKTRDVTLKIEELIGLDRNQFSRIAMIAQGDFLKLLLADTGERREIFRKIFGTQGFQELQKRIQEDTSKEQRSCDLLRERLKALKTDELDTQDGDEDKIESLIKELSEKYENIKGVLSRKEKTIQELRLMDERFRQVTAIDLELEKNLKEQQGCAVSLKLLEKKSKSLPFLNARIRAITEDLATGRERLEDYRRLNEVRQEYSEKVKSFKALAARLKRETELEAQCRLRVEQSRERLKNLDSLHGALNETAVNITKNQNRIQEINSAKTSVEEYTRARIAFEKEQVVFKELQAKQNDAQKKANEAEMHFLQGQAGVLSLLLKVGEPCPVCGSREHPTPAVKPESVPTQEELEGLKLLADKAMARLRENAESCAALGAKKEQCKKQVLERVKTAFGDIPIEDVKSKITEELSAALVEEKSLKAKHEGLKKQLSVLEELNQTIEADDKTLKQSAKTILDCTEQMAVAETRGKALGEKIRELEQSLEFKSFEQADARLKTLEESLKRAEGGAQKISESLKAKQQLSAELAATAKALEKQRKDLGDCQSVVDLLNKETVERDSLSEESRVVFSSLSLYKGILKQVSEIVKEEKVRRERLSWLSALSDTASGSVRGRQRVNFETFVQVSYFDMVIHAANLRLTKMTGGRYELKRKEQADSLKSQTGLELDVLDSLSGMLRSVKTLSGGESFKASLALALGLSDVVQSHAGGVKIHTMFVDEGFGSLDADSLELAVSALSELSQSGRLVGIISHVAELKEKIERKIIVSPGNGIKVE